MKKYVGFIVLLLMIFAPFILAFWAYNSFGVQMAIVISFIGMPLVFIAVGKIVRNKIEYGSYFFIKEQKSKTESLNSGFECPFCGARFTFRRLSCPDCGKNLRLDD